MFYSLGLLCNANRSAKRLISSKFSQLTDPARSPGVENSQVHTFLHRGLMYANVGVSKPHDSCLMFDV